MSDLIKREDAEKVLCDACGNAACPKGLIPRCSYYEQMQAIPAVDAVEVVRCRECGNWHENVHDRGDDSYCELWNAEMKADGYCVYGEEWRREDGDA